MGIDLTEFKLPWGKARFAPVYDFGSKEIVVRSTSPSPDMRQRDPLLDRLLERMPESARPVLHSDMGWQYQHPRWTERVRAAKITKSMSRKGNFLDNGAAEQVFGPRGTNSSGGGPGPTLSRSDETSTPTSSAGTRGGVRSD